MIYPLQRRDAKTEATQEAFIRLKGNNAAAICAGTESFFFALNKTALKFIWVLFLFFSPRDNCLPLF